MKWFPRSQPALTLLLWWWSLGARGILNQTRQTDEQLIKPGTIDPVDPETLELPYSIKDDFCFLVEQTTVVLKDETILITGGLGKFHYQDGKPMFVPDLNINTYSLDMTKNFKTSEWANEIKVLQQRPVGAYPTSRGCIWTDGTTVWLQGGHYYSDPPYYNTSHWSPPDSEIPKYVIWRFSKEKGWEKETDFAVRDGSVIQQTVSGGSACSPRKCYWVGGYINSRTSPPRHGLPPEYSAGRRGMLEFDLATKILTNRSMDDYTCVPRDQGFQLGSLHPLFFNDTHDGILISLMAEKTPIFPMNETSDNPYVSIGNDFASSVMIFDALKDKWYNQKSTAFYGENPPSRTRYCCVLVHDRESNTWDLWIFGGQRIPELPSEGVDNAYVLTMPAFIWVEIPLSNPQEYHLRSMTCHTRTDTSSEMIVVGAHTIGLRNETYDPCDDQLVKVFSLNDLKWITNYSATSAPYRQPEAVRRLVTERVPRSGWADARLQGIFDVDGIDSPIKPPGKPPSGLPRWVIPITVVLGVVVVVALCFGIRFWRRVEHEPPVRPDIPPPAPIEAP